MAAPIPAAQTYREFVADYIKTHFKKEEGSDVKLPSGTERLKIAAAAWRKLHGLPDPVAKRAAGEAGAGDDDDEDGADAASSGDSTVAQAGGRKKQKKAPIIFPSAPSSLREVANIFTTLNGVGATPEVPQVFSRSPAFTIPRTRKVQSSLRSSVKKFQSALKHGEVKCMSDAYTAGFNAFLDLARG